MLTVSSVCVSAWGLSVCPYVSLLLTPPSPLPRFPPSFSPGTTQNTQHTTHNTQHTTEATSERLSEEEARLSRVREELSRERTLLEQRKAAVRIHLFSSVVFCCVLSVKLCSSPCHCPTRDLVFYSCLVLFDLGH